MGLWSRPSVPPAARAGTNGPDQTARSAEWVGNPLVPVGDGPSVPGRDTNRDQRVWPPSEAWAPPFGPGLYHKPGQMSCAYIYGTPPPFSHVFFSGVGELV